MGLTKKINWLITLLSFNILRSILSGRITGKQNKFWLQTPNENKVNIYNRVDFILAYCKNKNVLHIGCTDHPFTAQKLENKSLLHQNLKAVVKNITGIDHNKDSIEEYKNLTGDYNIFYGDIMQAYPEEVSGEFDCIVLAEVLEHLINPSEALDILHNRFSGKTHILVTVPNYAALDSLAGSLNKTESIHPDHYWYFSPYTLTKLFNKEKFELQQLHFGMYYQIHKKINRVMKKYPFNGDCIIAVFSIKK